MHKKIYPSLMGADVLNLAMAVHQLENHCDGFHNDIMDNHFVPNITWGALISNALTTITNKPLWTHLMVEKPETIIQDLTIRTHDIISFHLESTNHIEHIVKEIAQRKGTAGIAIRPSTPLEALYPYLPLVNHVLLMSVEPGHAGQALVESTYNRLQGLVEHRMNNDLHFIIGVDGGINASNIEALSNGGANDFAIASAIFDQSDPVAALEDLRSRATL